jgi:hypothetical protein
MDPGPKPEKKPQPETFPKWNPTAVFLPLMDMNGAFGRVNYSKDPRFRPILAQLNTLLNDDILLIVPNIDILLHKQLPFVEHLKKDIEQNPIEGEKGKRVEGVAIKNGFHGWIESKKYLHNLMPRKCRFLVVPDRSAGPIKGETISVGRE